MMVFDTPLAIAVAVARAQQAELARKKAERVNHR